MIELNLRQLIKPTTPVVRKALEEGLRLAQQERHGSLEIEHVLFKILEESDSDLDRALEQLSIDIGKVSKELSQTLRKFRPIEAGQRRREVLRVERREVIDLLADANGVDRQAELVGECDEDAALRGAVELGHDEARDVRKIAEGLDLGERVLARGGVEDEEGVVRCLGVLLADHADDLGEFFHEVGAVLEAAPRCRSSGDRRSRPRRGSWRRRRGSRGRSPRARSSPARPRGRPRPGAVLRRRRGTCRRPRSPPTCRRRGTGSQACRWWWSCPSR